MKEVSFCHQITYAKTASMGSSVTLTKLHAKNVSLILLAMAKTICKYYKGFGEITQSQKSFTNVSPARLV